MNKRKVDVSNMQHIKINHQAIDIFFLFFVEYSDLNIIGSFVLEYMPTLNSLHSKWLIGVFFFGVEFMFDISEFRREKKTRSQISTLNHNMIYDQSKKKSLQKLLFDSHSMPKSSV